MNDFSFETLINILLPGFTILISFGLVVVTFAPTAPIAALLLSALESEFSAAIVIPIASALFGSVLASLTSVFELRHFDAKSAKLLEIDEAHYTEEWDLYLDFLSMSSNSYIGSKAVVFSFELRACAAFIVLGVSVGISVGWGWSCATLAALAIVLYVLAGRTHYVLAFWRHRTFGDKAVSNLASEDGGKNAARHRHTAN